MQKQKTKKSLAIVLLAIFLTNSITIFIIPNDIFNNSGDLNTSDLLPGIILNLPSREQETGVISEPDGGYYPSTYGFETDGFVDKDNSNGNCYVEIIGEFEGHSKVLDCYYSGNASENWRIRKTLKQEITAGTIEFYWSTSAYQSILGGELGRNTIFSFDDNSGNWGPIIYYSPNFFSCGLYVDIPGDEDVFLDITPKQNRWYHFRIDFDIDTDCWDLYIDGKSKGTYLYNQPEIEGPVRDLFFGSFNILSPEEYHVYYDAFGFSWDLKYDIGDNFHEGYLCSVTPFPTLPIALYMCKYDNIYAPILGDFVLPLYDGGDHNLRIFGFDSNGNQYFSNSIEYSCEPEGWNSKILIGSDNRAFPIEDNSRLGFTIQTEYCFKNFLPQIEYRIDQTTGSQGVIIINIYVDNALFETYSVLLRTEDMFIQRTIEVEELKTLIGHQIEIQIIDYFNEDDSIDDNNRFTLDYIKVGKLDFVENLIYEDTDVIHTPVQLYCFGPEANNAVVSINMRPSYINELGIVDGHINFRPQIWVRLDGDTTPLWVDYEKCYDFIDSITMTCKIISPNGVIYVPPSFTPGAVQSSHTDNGIPDDTLTKSLFWTELFLYITSETAPPYISIPAGAIDYALGFIGDPQYQKAKGEAYEISDGVYKSYWEIGKDVLRWANGEIISIEPNPLDFVETTMCTTVVEDVPNEDSENRISEGSYQIVIDWSVNIKRCVRHVFGCEIKPREVISGTYYSNFIFKY